MPISYDDSHKFIPIKSSAYKRNWARLIKFVIPLILLVVFFNLNKIIFFLILFIILTFLGKIVRGMLRMDMIVFDPLIFFSTIITWYFNIKYLFVFLFITVFVADMVSGIFTGGSIINYFLFHISPLLAFVLLRSFNYMIFANATAVIYALLYIFARTRILPDDPARVVIKAGSALLFVFLYSTILYPVVELVFKL